jgi:hypothetical protein
LVFRLDVTNSATAVGLTAATPKRLGQRGRLALRTRAAIPNSAVTTLGEALKQYYNKAISRKLSIERARVSQHGVLEMEPAGSGAT